MLTCSGPSSALLSPPRSTRTWMSDGGRSRTTFTSSGTWRGSATLRWSSGRRPCSSLTSSEASPGLDRRTSTDSTIVWNERASPKPPSPECACDRLTVLTLPVIFAWIRFGATEEDEDLPMSNSGGAGGGAGGKGAAYYFPLERGESRTPSGRGRDVDGTWR